MLKPTYNLSDENLIMLSWFPAVPRCAIHFIWARRLFVGGITVWRDGKMLLSIPF